jgi:hypothetical protein
MHTIHQQMFFLAALVGLVGCSVPHANRNAPGGNSQIVKAEPPPWSFFLTITPEQIQAARSAPECRPADNDSDGNWGAPWEGVQLSIRLQKKVFTNGEPIVGCFTLRNVGDKVRYFWVLTPEEQRSTRITVLRDQKRLVNLEDAKPGESFQGRLRHIYVGKSYQEPLIPGTQRQFLLNLSGMFDLAAAGSYSAHAEREVAVLERVPDLTGHIRGSGTNLLSGAVVFRVVGSSRSE